MNDENSKQSDSTIKPSRRRYIITAVIIFLCILAGLIYRAMTWESKPDPASEKIIRQIAAKQLYKEPNELSDEDFAKITILKIESKGSLKIGDEYNYFIENTWGNLSDIKLLEKFTNLRELELIMIYPSNENIPKWKMLLERIGIINKKDMKKRLFFDLKPLENLKNLTKLDFRYSDIKNIKPLKKLKNLKSLNLTNCTNVTDKQVEDLQKALPELEIDR